MAPTLYFIGTGSAETRGQLNEGGFLIRTDKTTLHVDPGPGAAHGLGRLKIKEVDAIVMSSSERSHDASLIKSKQIITDKTRVDTIDIIKKDEGYLFKHPDGSIGYITNKVKKMKDYQADVLVIAAHGQEEKLLTTLKPRLAILTTYSHSMKTGNPLYYARDLQKKTGVQTIAAHDELTVDLDSYSALSEQKALSKFTTES